jgi:endo-1,4-beta-xylanase
LYVFHFFTRNQRAFFLIIDGINGIMCYIGYYREVKQGATMKSKMVLFGTYLALMAAVLVFTGCPPDKVTDDIPVTEINLNKSSLTLAVGDSEKLEYTITPVNATNKQVSWFSNDTNFATVSNGTVTAVAAGTAIITVTTEDGGKTASVTVNVVQSVPVTGITLNKTSLTLTIHSSEKVLSTITPSNATNKNVTWSSSNNNVATVAPDGTITAVNFSSGGNNKFTSSPATGAATITATTADGGKTAAITVNTTMAAQVDILTLPPLKDKFADKFLIGNIFRGSTTGGWFGPSDEVSGTGADARIIDERLTRHFNALTAENAMKPSYLISGYDAATGVTWNTFFQPTVDNFVDAANNSGMKVIGHTLLWHSQNPNWVWEQIAGKTGTAVANKPTALAAMRAYINAVAGRYAGKIYSWDVLNEAFPDNAGGSANWKDAIRKGAGGEGQDANPWYVAIGSDFVYEGFLAARRADPNAILYYNDYNTDMPNRARLIRDMVQEVNNKYKTSGDKPVGEAAGRLLIEGIGMQEHHNNGITAARIKATIDLFRPLGVKLSVTELDIIAFPDYQSYSSSSGTAANSDVTNQALLTQAGLFGDYMKLYLDNADIIERVSLWGVTDNVSWRGKGLPLLFDPDGKAKPAYYKFVGAQ